MREPDTTPGFDMFCLFHASMRRGARVPLMNSPLMLPPHPFRPIRSAPSFHASPDSRSRPRASRPRPHRSHAAMESCGGCAGPVNGVAQGGVPGCGLRDGVLHLPFLLPEAGLLRGCLPEESPTATTSEGEQETPGQPRRTGRSPGPATGLRETGPPPNDGCNFPRPRSIGQYLKT